MNYFSKISDGKYFTLRSHFNKMRSDQKCVLGISLKFSFHDWSGGKADSCRDGISFGLSRRQKTSRLYPVAIIHVNDG